MTKIKIFDWYLSREITGKSIIAGLWLLVVYLFLALLDELQATESRPFSSIAVSLGYAVPKMIYELSPMILLIGGILSLALLSRQQEIMALVVNGVSKFRIVGSVLGYSAFVAVLVFIWGELVVPFTETQGAEFASVPISEEPGVAQHVGVWIRHENDFVYIERIDRLREMEGVRIYHFDQDGNFRGQSAAKSGLIAADLTSFKLQNVMQLMVDNNTLQEQTVLSQTYPVKVDRLKLALENTNPSELTVFELYKSVQLRKEEGLKTEFYELEMWNRIIIPLSMLVMGMFAVLFTFHSNTRLSTGHFVMFGLLFGLFYFAIQQSVGYVAILNGLPPIVGTFAVFFVFFCSGAVALFRD